MLAFATSLRRNTDADFDELRVEFERILVQLVCRSAQLDIEDEETGPRYFTYAYGPMGSDDQYVWVRVRQQREFGVEEMLGEDSSEPERGTAR